MKSQSLTSKNFLRYKGRKQYKRFLLLGSDTIKEERFMRNIIRPKLRKEYSAQVPGFWGTLGFADGKLRKWEGEIRFSEYGNDRFKGAVKSEAKLIKDIFALPKDARMTERFISFDNSSIEFPKGEFKEKDIPEMRLTLMLKDTESALVFYEHKNPETGETLVEYIMPEATPKHESNKRDRLTYKFKALSQFQYEPANEERITFKMTTRPTGKQFLLKTLVFTRKEIKDSFELLNFIKRNQYCNGTKQTHCLLKFNPRKNKFIKKTARAIDSELKTLFLIHGTFSSTEKSFKALLESNWLSDLLSEKDNAYKQIIAFDHPTVTDGAKSNIAVLFNLLGENFKFKKPVDIIATSQGGLLAQYLANYNAKTTKIPVGKVALVASANGVDYLTTGHHIAKFLTVMKYTLKASGRKGAAFIAGIASQSAKFFLNQPGCQVMTPKNKALTDIINTKPASKTTCYLPIIDDFDKHSQVDKRKWLFRTLSVIVLPIMGRYNDLVVRTENQFNIHKDYCCIPDYAPEKFKKYMYSSLHGKALDIEYVQNDIRLFFETEECSC